MTEVDFYQLDRSVQDRFADSTRAIGVPVPILRVAPTDRSYLVWFAMSAATMIACSILAWRGVGDLASEIAIAPVWVLGGLALGYALGVFCLLRGLVAQRRFIDKPYRPGLYLFPIGVIDARQEPFRVAGLSEIKAVIPDGDKLVRVDLADGKLVSFPAENVEAATAVQASIDEARRAYEHAVRTQSRRELALLDPLVDSGFSSPFSPKLRLKKQVPAWQRLALPIALAAGVSLGAGVWIVRNRVSERRLYEEATEADTVEAYRAYIARRGSRPNVAEILLPRAELRVAQEARTVEAIEEYLAKHPNSQIGGEVQSALQAVLDAELQKAKDEGTVTALRRFVEKRRAYEQIKKPTELAIDALYRRSLENYLKVANPEHPETPAFFERLLGYAEGHGPTVEIRFMRRLPESVEDADSAVRRSAYYMGNASVPSQYFDDEGFARRESEMVPEIVKRLQAPFPEDIVKFSVAPAIPIEPPVETPPAPKVPTLLVLSESHMSGGYMSRKPRGVFVGVGMKFSAEFVIPGDSKPLRIQSSTWRVPNAQILKEDGAKIADVYEAMAKYGYEKFQRRVLEYFFANP
jgi:hypothetical protein